MVQALTVRNAPHAAARREPQFLNTTLINGMDPCGTARSQEAIWFDQVCLALGSGQVGCTVVHLGFSQGASGRPHGSVPDGPREEKGT